MLSVTEGVLEKEEDGTAAEVASLELPAGNPIFAISFLVFASKRY
jgi:hypothetical protein